MTLSKRWSSSFQSAVGVGVGDQWCDGKLKAGCLGESGVQQHYTLLVTAPRCSVAHDQHAFSAQDRPIWMATAP
jgi:hypothetical protein